MNGHAVSSWEDVETQFTQQSRNYDISLYRGNAFMTIRLTMEKTGEAIPKQPTGGLLPAFPAIVGQVNSGSPASKGGMAAGDTVVAINKAPVHSWF
jgi:S1-C subfamily serine protease